jgi:putative ABC transport system substrate-binding protein
VKRREFITLIGAATAWPIRARSQPSSPIRPLIGLLSPLSAAAARHNIAAFRSGLREFGFLEGRNATVEVRYGAGAPERLDLLAGELVALKPEVLVAGSKSGAMAVHRTTRTIPTVVLTPEDPVVSGLANTIVKPGGNLTGIWLLGDDALVGKRLEFLHLAVPGLARVAVVVNPDDPTDSLTLQRLPATVAALGTAVKVFELRDTTRLDSLAQALSRTDVQGLFIGQGPTLNSARAEITALAAHLRLPAIYGLREFAEAGGLISYGPNLPDMYRQASRLVARILKGESPGDLPFERPIRYELVVNLKAAKAIGFAIPDSFVLLADEVIE